MDRSTTKLVNACEITMEINKSSMLGKLGQYLELDDACTVCVL